MGAVTITAINAIVVELYPTNIRGMALSIAAMFARLGAMTGSNFIGHLMYKYCDYMFFIFAAIHLSKCYTTVAFYLKGSLLQKNCSGILKVK